MHYEIEESLRDIDQKFLNIIAPRGFAKTSIVGIFFTLWHIFVEHVVRKQERKPKVVLLVSKNRLHAKSILRTIKRILDHNHTFRFIFGEWGEATSQQWTQSQIILKDGTVIACRGTGQAIRGLQEDFKRPTLIILDDPEDEENTKTAERMEFNLKWCLQTLRPALDKKTGRLIVIGTPQHQRSMVMELKDDSRFRTLHFSAGEVEGSEVIESHWPEWWPVEELQEERDALSRMNRVSVFNREYMCVISSDDARTFDSWKQWEGELQWDKLGNPYLQITHKSAGREFELEELESAEERPVNLFMGVDPASSTSETADYSVILLLAVDEDGNRYVVDYWRKRRRPIEVGKQVVSMYKQYEPVRTKCETVAYQEMLSDFLQSEFVDVTIPGIGSEDEKPKSKKSKRLEGMQPYFAEGAVFLRKGMRELEDELLMYPDGKHDDCLDALYYAMKHVWPPTHGIIKSEKGVLDHYSKRNKNRADWMTW